MQLIVDLVGVALAIGGTVDVWRNGSLFAGHRADLQARQDGTDPESWWQLVYELLLCSFCHTYQLGIWLLVLLTVSDALAWPDLLRTLLHFLNCEQPPAAIVNMPVGQLIRAAVFGVAAARLSWIINGLLPPHLRYNRLLLEPRNDASPVPTPGNSSDDPHGPQ